MRFGHRSAPAESGGPLDEVFEAERSAATAIDAAHRDAAAWLAGEKAAIQQAADAEMAVLDDRHAADIGAGQSAAAARAAELVAAADAFAQQLQALTDEELRPIVNRHVAGLLPGAAR